MSTPIDFNGVVRFTRIGTAYLIFTLLVGFAAINTGNNSLYIALAFMLGGLIISGMASKGGLKRMELEFLGLREAWAGQAASGSLRLVNRSRVWNVRDVVVTSDELEEPMLFPLIRRGETVEAEGKFLFRRRGRVQLKSANLYTRYPFGLFLKKRKVKLHGEAIIYPSLLRGGSDLVTANRQAGQVGHADRVGPGSEIRSFREYQPGDSLRQIHWKKTASVGRWIMKQTELESHQFIEIAIDPTIPPGASAEEFERLVSECATYVRDALHDRLEIALHTPDGTIRGGGEAAWDPMFEALALVQSSTASWAAWFDSSTVVFSLDREHETRSA